MRLTIKPMFIKTKEGSEENNDRRFEMFYHNII